MFIFVNISLSEAEKDYNCHFDQYQVKFLSFLSFLVRHQLPQSAS